MGDREGGLQGEESCQGVTRNQGTQGGPVGWVFFFRCPPGGTIARGLCRLLSAPCQFLAPTLGISFIRVSDNGSNKFVLS